MKRSVLMQKEMCELSDTDTALMSRYLTGKQKPSLSAAKRISEACNVPIEIFLECSIQEHFLGKSFLEEDIDYTLRKERVWGSK